MSNFTQAEAEAKVGKTVRSLVEFSGVAKGSVGKVVKADSMGHSLKRGVKEEVWDVVIEWKQNPLYRVFGSRRRTLLDWFSKDEYEKYLEEV